MVTYKDIEEHIKELKALDFKSKKKDIIRRLGEDIEKALKEQNPRIINQFKLNQLEPETENILELIKWYVEQNELDIKETTIRTSLPKHQKKAREGKGESDIVRLTDNYLEKNADEILGRIKDLRKGAAQDIKTKIRREEIDLQGWNNEFSKELVELAKKIEEDYRQGKVNKELLKEMAHRVKMVRDSRFATTWAHYEAIVVATSCTKSLTKAIEDEKHVLFREEIDRNEKNCEECFCSGAPKNKCNCHCHRVTQDMTTKGLKWALKHNRPLAEFDEHFKRIADMDHEDLCPYIKSLFSNPNMDKHVSSEDKLNIFHKHIDGKDGCVKCELFYEEHPEFFEVKK